MGQTPNPDSFVLLKTCRDDVEAMSLRSLLEAEGIEVFVQGEHHRAVEGALMGAMIELRAMVRQADLDEARELIEELDYAEHLPAEPVPADPDDKSLQQFRDRETGTNPDAPRNPTSAVWRAMLLPFGGGHLYAGRTGVAAVLAAIQALNVILGLLGWGVGTAVMSLIVFDALFSAAALRRDQARLALPD